MFTVTGIATGVCVACEKQGEVLKVHCPAQAFCGLLCVADFKKLVKIATATQPSAMTAEPNSAPTPTSGDGAAAAGGTC